jgi:hypothetical protein
MFKVILTLVIVGWILRKIWEIRFSRRTGLPPTYFWRNPTPEEIKRMENEADAEIERIEERVGMGNETGAAASILEGSVDWEDFVDPGFEREKRRWFALHEQLSSLARLKAPHPTRM